ncbi:E3 SUMO-protein ligase NSE2 [Bulinus truncatus]|nr:E3 SUMO-protein ligase NSE2 [Bulinus truncatus]
MHKRELNSAVMTKYNTQFIKVFGNKDVDTQTKTTDDGSAIDYPQEFNRVLARSKQSNIKEYQSHPKYKELEDCLIEAGSLEEQISALRDKLTLTSSSDDIVVTEVEINTKCPITGKTIVFPMRNKLCGHVYDKAGITSYINSRKAKAKCPAVGCGNRNPITVDILEEHPDLRKYIQLLNKLQGLKVIDDLSETL